jgi:hypothetical protein
MCHVKYGRPCLILHTVEAAYGNILGQTECNDMNQMKAMVGEFYLVIVNKFVVKM